MWIDFLNYNHDARKYIVTRINTSKPTVTKMFGDPAFAYFCHYYCSESWSIFPILHLGIIFYWALTEWLAC